MEIHTSDDAVVDSVVESLTELRARRLDRARNIDPMSVVVIAGAVLTLVNGLLDLQGHLRRRGSGGEAAERTAPEVVIVVRNENGDAVRLADADRADLQRIVEVDATDEDDEQ
ncbi:hypothetical protein AB0B78_37445 [Streptomyces sp. NPDC040724]|uniref:hypothetical protein n=1 Tax=Streptomyces sp. NPDC040724 TaxID=3155612 RepID=UPI0033E88CFD